MNRCPCRPTRAPSRRWKESPREERSGIPVTPALRNYRNRSHKPELLVALGRFEARAGFRSAAASVELMCALAVSDLDPFVNLLSGQSTPTDCARCSPPRSPRRSRTSQHHRLRPRGEGTRRALPDADARRHQGPARPPESRHTAGQHRTDHSAPANKTMVIDLAKAAGLSPDQLYFNIEQVASSASIPPAIHDPVRDQVITTPTRVFAPGFGAGAVAGYAVLRIDPAVIAPESQVVSTDELAMVAESITIPAGADMALAFG